MKHAQFFPCKFSWDAGVWVKNYWSDLSHQLLNSLTEHLFPGQAGQYMPRRSDGAQLSVNNTLGLIWTHFCWQNRLFVQQLSPVGTFSKWKYFIVQPCKLLRDFQNKQTQAKILLLFLNAWWFPMSMDGRRKISFLVVTYPAISEMSLTGLHCKKHLMNLPLGLHSWRKPQQARLQLRAT